MRAFFLCVLNECVASRHCLSTCLSSFSPVDFHLIPSVVICRCGPLSLVVFLFLATFVLRLVSYSSSAGIWSKRPFVSYRPMTLPLWPTVSLL